MTKEVETLGISFPYPLPVLRALVEKGIWESEDGNLTIVGNFYEGITPEQKKMMLTLIEIGEKEESP
jgi:hypothetical protein